MPGQKICYKSKGRALHSDEEHSLTDLGLNFASYLLYCTSLSGKILKLSDPVSSCKKHLTVQNVMGIERCNKVLSTVLAEWQILPKRFVIIIQYWILIKTQPVSWNKIKSVPLPVILCLSCLKRLYRIQKRSRNLQSGETFKKRSEFVSRKAAFLSMWFAVTVSVRTWPPGLQSRI